MDDKNSYTTEYVKALKKLAYSEIKVLDKVADGYTSKATFVSIYTAAMLREKITMDNLNQGSDIYNAILEGKKAKTPF